MRHLVEHVASQMTFEIGSPDPARMGDVLGAVERAYGTSEKAYENLVELRDGRARAVLGPLDWSGPAPSDGRRS
jgi:ketoreductase RED1